MEIQKFIENVAEQFDDLNTGLTPETRFREVEGWTSLVALLVITMVDEEYGVVLPPEEMRKTQTIKELFDLVNSKL
ncbi:MAG: acyl carrier protein [Paludibacteraceae bacterium]|jgi:acyl carrier protein|nr:acyl carrier protein [Paludibacteraceae bacterium]